MGTIEGNSCVRWEFKTVSAKVTGANWGAMSAFMDKGLPVESLKELADAGRQGWVVAAMTSIVYGGAGATGCGILIMMKRRLAN